MVAGSAVGVGPVVISTVAVGRPVAGLTGIGELVLRSVEGPGAAVDVMSEARMGVTVVWSAEGSPLQADSSRANDNKRTTCILVPLSLVRNFMIVLMMQALTIEDTVCPAGILYDLIFIVGG